MSLIVSFPLHRVAPVAAHFSGAHEAEVVIFPGVRIDRHSLSASDLSREVQMGAARGQERDAR